MECGEVITRDNVSPNFSPGCFLLQSTYVEGPAAPGNFEFLLIGNEGYVQHFYRDNAGADLPVHFTNQFTKNAIGGGTVIQSSFGMEGGPGNFEAVFIEEPGIWYTIGEIIRTTMSGFGS
jgi:hypothetical protein